MTRASVRSVLRGEWTLILHFPGIRASLHANYDGPDNVRDKFLQIHGKPGLRDVLNQLAQYGAGQQMSYQTGRDLFTFTVTAGMEFHPLILICHMSVTANIEQKTASRRSTIGLTLTKGRREVLLILGSKWVLYCAIWIDCCS